MITIDTPIKQFTKGILDELPLIMGVSPFGIIVGVMALHAGLNPLEGQMMSSLVFAGSAQFMVVRLIQDNTPALVIIVSTFIINLRHALYSASVSQYLKGLSTSWKLLLSYLLTDEAYAVSILHFNKNAGSQNLHWHLLGSGFTLWLSWQISTAVGIFLGTQIPAEWGLDFTLPLVFIAIVMPSLKDRPSTFTAITALILSLVFFQLPYKLGLILASFVAIALGLWLERK
ncbi:MAG TPA: AzlC family ABC transporter permease [Anaerolineales bacterium]|nr:AzlC family ABC transporter permease [Anaerolineales bacterium]